LAEPHEKKKQKKKKNTTLQATLTTEQLLKLEDTEVQQLDDTEGQKKIYNLIL
jgi:hypothetical protein